MSGTVAYQLAQRQAGSSKTISYLYPQTGHEVKKGRRSGRPVWPRDPGVAGAPAGIAALPARCHYAPAIALNAAGESGQDGGLPCIPATHPEEDPMFAKRWLLAAIVVLPVFAAPAPAQKYGGVLKAVHRENPPNLSIHENATVSTTWPMTPVYSNLVFYNYDNAVETTDDLVAELAESWAWSDGGKKLTFKLRRGVKWHDGRPFSARDVKHTFDTLREAGGAKRLRLNPRKLWYENVKDVVANGDYEVSFVLERPQPSLLSMLANGYTPIYPAHIDPGELRTRAVGTGPFKLKTYEPDKLIEVEKNPDFFIKGRPYLDGITYTVIKDRQARAAALMTGQI